MQRRHFLMNAAAALPLAAGSVAAIKRTQIGRAHV